MLCDTMDWYFSLERVGIREDGYALLLEHMQKGMSAIDAMEEIARKDLDTVRQGMAAGNGPETYRKVRRVLDGIKQLHTQLTETNSKENI